MASGSRRLRKKLCPRSISSRTALPIQTFNNIIRGALGKLASTSRTCNPFANSDIWLKSQDTLLIFLRLQSSYQTKPSLHLSSRWMPLPPSRRLDTLSMLSSITSANFYRPEVLPTPHRAEAALDVAPAAIKQEVSAHIFKSSKVHFDANLV